MKQFPFNSLAHDHLLHLQQDISRHLIQSFSLSLAPVACTQIGTPESELFDVTYPKDSSALYPIESDLSWSLKTRNVFYRRKFFRFTQAPLIRKSLALQVPCSAILCSPWVSDISHSPLLAMLLQCFIP